MCSAAGKLQPLLDALQALSASHKQQLNPAPAPLKVQAVQYVSHVGPDGVCSRTIMQC